MNKQTSKQNITRDIDIKNKLTVARGEVREDNGGERREGCQGPSIKDTWTKPKEGIGSRVGYGDGWGGGGVGKMETTVLELQ